jgi:hypothetical protein
VVNVEFGKREYSGGGWANPDQFRYQHVSCVFLLLMAIPVLSLRAFDTHMMTSLALISLFVSLPLQNSWAIPYREYAITIKNDLCDQLTKDTEMTFTSEELIIYSKKGWLRC